MRSRLITRLFIMTALVFVAGTSTAAAMSWTTNGTAGGTPFTASAPASRWQISSTPTAVSVICGTTSLTGVLFGPGPSLPSLPPAKLTLGCTSVLVASLSSTMSCVSNGLPAFVTGLTVAGATPLSLQASGATICTISVIPLPGCIITMQPTSGPGTQAATATYQNATAQLTLSASGQTMTASWNAACTFFATRPGSATVTYGTNATPPANLTYTVTTAFKPQITAF